MASKSDDFPLEIDPTLSLSTNPLLPAKETLHPPTHTQRRLSSSSAASNISIIRTHSPFPAAPPTPLQKCRQSLYANRGLFIIFLSQFFASLMALTTRILETAFPEQRFHAMQILFARQSITTLGCIAWMYYARVPDAPFGKRGIRWLLVGRGVGGFFGVFGLYYSLTYLDLSDATVITFMAPVLASWVCSVIPALREPFTRTEMWAGVVSFVGVVFIARPAALFAGGDGADEEEVEPSVGRRGIEIPEVEPHQRLIAVGVALIGVLGAAWAYTFIRWIGKRSHPVQTVVYFSAWCTIVSFVSLLFLPSIGGFVWPSGWIQWGLLIGIGTSGFIMQTLLTKGLQLEKAGRGTQVVYTQQLFAIFWERVVFGQVPGWLSVAGSTLIMGSVVWVGVSKSVGKKEPTGDEELALGRYERIGEDEVEEEEDELWEIGGLSDEEFEDAREVGEADIGDQGEQGKKAGTA